MYVYNPFTGKLDNRLPIPVPVSMGGTGTTTTFTQGSVIFAGASGVYTQDNANLFWDDTNNRLGIGTATPKNVLHLFTSNIQMTFGGNSGPNWAGNAYNNGSGWKYIQSSKAAVLLGLLPNGSTAGDYGIYTAPTGTADAAVTWTNRFITLENGRTGINKEVPTAMLHVKGDFKVESSSSTLLHFKVDNSITATFPRTFFQGGNSAGDTNWLMRFADAYSSSATNIPAGIQVSTNNDASYTNAYTASIYQTTATAYIFTALGAASTGTSLRFTTDGTLVTTGIFLDTLTNSHRVGIGNNTSPTARLHIAAGSTTASTAPLKFTSGSLNTVAEAGAVEFLTDKYYATITTAAARKELALNEAALTAGSVLFANSSGRIAQDNSNLFFDDTNNFLGVGTATPKNTLHIYTSNVQMTFGANNGPNWAGNAYYNGGYKYIQSGKAAVLLGLMPNGATAGDYGIYTAPTGTADTAITWTNRFITLENGRTGINKEVPTAMLHVKGDFTVEKSDSTTNKFNVTNVSAGAGYPRTNFQGGDSTADNNWIMKFADAYSSSALNIPIGMQVSTNNDSNYTNAYSFTMYQNTSVAYLFTALGPASGGTKMYLTTDGALVNVGLTISTQANLQRVGLYNITSPTAALHLPAGSASASTAPLKLTTGTDNTVAEAGAMEFGSSRLAFTPSGTTRKRVALTNDVTPSNGQLPIGNGTDFTTAAITAGSGISVTNGAGTITVASTGNSPWTEVTGTSQSAAVNNGYIANNAGLVTVTLPTTAAVGDIVRVVGKGAGLYSIAQNANQIVYLGSSTTTTGVGGSLTATNRRDAIELVCVVINNEWSVISSVGSFTVV